MSRAKHIAEFARIDRQFERELAIKIVSWDPSNGVSEIIHQNINEP